MKRNLLLCVMVGASLFGAKSEWTPAVEDTFIEYRWERTNEHLRSCVVEFRDAHFDDGTDFRATIRYKTGDNPERSIDRYVRIETNAEGGYGTSVLRGICDTVTGVAANFVER